MTMNEGGWDRVIRAAVGVVLLCAAWLSLSGATSLVAAVIGVILVLTGFAGWCPVYSLFNVSTRKKASV
jgi:hypothetical protein